LMRVLAYREECGVQSIAYRSCAGVVHQCLVFCLPGETSMIKCGMEKIIIPEINHLFAELMK
jgi:molybdenum cofactor biosynthesis protein B